MKALPLLFLPLFLFLFPSTGAAQIEWLTLEEAVTRNGSEPRKFLIDVYTDWCGWCKKMDKTTFADPKVAAYVSEHFYAVKFNAEQQAEVDFLNHTFKFDATAGRRGAHELAVALLDGRLSYPSIVYLDDQGKRITISPGFKTADKYIHEVKFVGGEHYKTKTYQQYLQSAKK